jgi:Fe-S cluster assembly iron-binding protein IscA
VDAGLSYDLKFDKTKGENDKIFIDNEITIAVEKIIPLFSWNCFRILAE